MDHLVAATLAVFAGSIVEAILGFGCSLVWMSFFPLFTTVPDAVGVLQPMHIALNAILLVSIWKRCTPEALKPLAMTVPFGIVFGLWIVTSWSSNAIDCVLGIFLIVYTFLKNDEGEEDTEHSRGAKKTSLHRKTSDLELDPLDEVEVEEEKKDDSHQMFSPIEEELPHPTPETPPLTHRHATSVADYNSNNNNNNNNNKINHAHGLATKSKVTKVAGKGETSKNMMRNPTAICAGLVGGALMGAFGTGGPAFLVFAREAGWQKRPELFRANLQLLFFAINVPVCLSQYAEGIITYERCKASCCLLPALVAGGSFGRVLAKKVPRDKFQILVVNGLRIMGLMFLIEATRPEE